MQPHTQAHAQEEDNRIVLDGISWEQYEQLQQVFEGRHIRLTYDEGLLEIMTTGFLHEGEKQITGRLLELMSLELDIPIAGFGGMTWKRKFLEKGLESDECYFVKNEPATRNLAEFDDQKLVPDLVVEIEVSRRLGIRRGIYAALQVPELWCFDGEVLTILHLTGEKRYQEQSHSLNFPFLAASDLQQFLLMRKTVGEHQTLREFQKWVRETHGGKR